MPSAKLMVKLCDLETLTMKSLQMNCLEKRKTDTVPEIFDQLPWIVAVAQPALVLKRMLEFVALASPAVLAAEIEVE